MFSCVVSLVATSSETDKSCLVEIEAGQASEVQETERLIREDSEIDIWSRPGGDGGVYQARRYGGVALST